MDGRDRSIANASGLAKGMENTEFQNAVRDGGYRHDSSGSKPNAIREGLVKTHQRNDADFINTGNQVAMALKKGDVDQACALIPCLKFMTET
jgi:hypothetical protein